MLSTCPRFAKLESKEFLGVGTYTLRDPRTYLFHVPQDGCGFLTSSKKRGSFLTKNDKLPAPNEYYVDCEPNHIKGGNSMQYTEEKCKPLVNLEETPGPADYQPYTKDPCNYEYVLRKGKLHKGRPPQCMYLETDKEKYEPCDKYISIKNSNRRTIKSRQSPQLVRRGTEFPAEMNATTLKYKGIFWSKRTSAREKLATVSNSPGPGSYNITKSGKRLKFSNYLYEYTRQVLARRSYVRRWLEQREYDALKEACPRSKSCLFTCSDKLYKSEKPKKQSKPRGTFFLAKRFKEKLDVSPGCGQYDIQNNETCITKRCTDLQDLSPFLSSAPRFPKKIDRPRLNITVKQRVKFVPLYRTAEYKGQFPRPCARDRFSTQIIDTPSPGEYTIDGMWSRLQRRISNIYGTKVYPFNTSADRYKHYSCLPMEFEDITTIRYNELSKEQYNQKTTSVGRPIEKIKMLKDICPNSYNKDESPGPQTYCINRNESVKGGVIPEAIPRTYTEQTTPCPTTYTISDSMYKPHLNTFNYKLKVGVNPQRKYPTKYCQLVNSRKFLRRFIKPHEKL